MIQETIALVFMADDTEIFFIEDPPAGPPEKWIGRFVNDINQVEHVQVIERGPMLFSWSNPNVSPETD